MARKDAMPGAKEKAAQRRRAAIEYRKAGLTYRAIADRLGISPQQAYRDVQATLKQIHVESLETAEEMVQLEQERLDNYLVALAGRLSKGELQAIDRAIKISESRRKLLGLDAPMKIAPTNPEGDKSYAPASLDERLAALDERLGRIGALLDRGRTRRDRNANRSDSGGA